MKVAIIGAGFCGLAVAWQLIQQIPNIKITLFDYRNIGQGTSGIAAGLLHPFSGAHAKLNWNGFEGLSATKELLDVASKALGQSVIAKSNGILRLAITEQQQIDFQKCAELAPSEADWLDSQTCQTLAPGCAHYPGLWLKEGLTIYSSLYLQGLWQACSQRGVQFEKKMIGSLGCIQGYDLTIATVGAECLHLPELAPLPIKMVKGQVLEMGWPNKIPLPCSLNSQIYIIMTEKGKSCLVGATYEKGFSEAVTDIETAKKNILSKAFELYPSLKNAPILNIYAGMRAVGPQHRPLIKKISASQWVLTGMGSKGLLYHALFAKELVKSIIMT